MSNRIHFNVIPYTVLGFGTLFEEGRKSAFFVSLLFLPGEYNTTGQKQLGKQKCSGQFHEFSLKSLFLKIVLYEWIWDPP